MPADCRINAGYNYVDQLIYDAILNYSEAARSPRFHDRSFSFVIQSHSWSTVPIKDSDVWHFYPRAQPD
jgi:hypothetical protein